MSQFWITRLSHLITCLSYFILCYLLEYQFTFRNLFFIFFTYHRELEEKSQSRFHRFYHIKEFRKYLYITYVFIQNYYFLIHNVKSILNLWNLFLFFYLLSRFCNFAYYFHVDIFTCIFHHHHHHHHHYYYYYYYFRQLWYQQ